MPGRRGDQGPESICTAESVKRSRRRWAAREKIIVGVSLLLLISLFLPWFRVGVLGAGPEAGWSGLRVHRFLWIVVILALAEPVFLMLPARPDSAASDPVPAGRMPLAGATFLNFLIVLLAFAFKPAISGQQGSLIVPGVVSFGWLPGAFLALIAFAVAMVAACLPPWQRLHRKGYLLRKSRRG
jgi:hypothetical protein